MPVLFSTILYPLSSSARSGSELQSLAGGLDLIWHITSRYAKTFGGQHEQRRAPCTAGWQRALTGGAVWLITLLQHSGASLHTSSLVQAVLLEIRDKRQSHPPNPTVEQGKAIWIVTACPNRYLQGSLHEASWVLLPQTECVFSASLSLKMVEQALLGKNGIIWAMPALG